MACEIVECEFSKSLFSTQLFCFPHSFFQKCIGKLFPTPRSTTNQSVQLCPHDYVCQTLNVGLDTYVNQYYLKLLPGEIFVTLQCFDDCGIAFGKQHVIELEFPIVMRKERFHTRCRQFKHPADILWHDEMPGRTHYMSAQDCTFIKSFFKAFI